MFTNLNSSEKETLFFFLENRSLCVFTNHTLVVLLKPCPPDRDKRKMERQAWCAKYAQFCRENTSWHENLVNFVTWVTFPGPTSPLASSGNQLIQTARMPSTWMLSLKLAYWNSPWMSVAFISITLLLIAKAALTTWVKSATKRPYAFLNRFCFPLTK